MRPDEGVVRRLLRDVVAQLLGRGALRSLSLCAAERELAGEPLTPDAGRQEASARARRLHELRRQFGFASLTKQIGMALAVVPQMRFGVHGFLLPPFKTEEEDGCFRSFPVQTSPSSSPAPILRAHRRGPCPLVAGFIGQPTGSGGAEPAPF